MSLVDIFSYQPCVTYKASDRSIEWEDVNKNKKRVETAKRLISQNRHGIIKNGPHSKFIRKYPAAKVVT